MKVKGKSILSQKRINSIKRDGKYENKPNLLRFCISNMTLPQAEWEEIARIKKIADELFFNLEAVEELHTDPVGFMMKNGVGYLNVTSNEIELLKALHDPEIKDSILNHDSNKFLMLLDEKNLIDSKTEEYYKNCLMEIIDDTTPNTVNAVVVPTLAIGWDTVLVVEDIALWVNASVWTSGGGEKAYIDPDLCVGCGACAEACPRNCIYEMDEGYYFIADDLCDSCGACIDVCPVEAISMGSKSVSNSEEIALSKKLDYSLNILSYRGILEKNPSLYLSLQADENTFFIDMVNLYIYKEIEKISNVIVTNKNIKDYFKFDDYEVKTLLKNGFDKLITNY